MADLKQSKRPRYKPGMVYAVPLADGSFGVAQAGHRMFSTVIYVALFLDRFETAPVTPPALDESKIISLTATWRRDLNKGEWVPLGVSELTPSLMNHPAEALAAGGYVGARHCDASLLAKFLSACHGALPWNVMYDPSFYEALLISGASRPAHAVILGEEERANYRREVFGVGA